VDSQIDSADSDRNRYYCSGYHNNQYGGTSESCDIARGFFKPFRPYGILMRRWTSATRQAPAVSIALGSARYKCFLNFFNHPKRSSAHKESEQDWAYAGHTVSLLWQSKQARRHALTTTKTKHSPPSLR
jgi:hypothetical protein